MEKKEPETKLGLINALAAFHEKVGKIRKDAKNPYFKSSYASLPNILDEIKPILKECGIVIVQTPGLTEIIGQQIDKDAAVYSQLTMRLNTTIYHVKTNERISESMSMPITKADPQGAGSAITYMRRYALVSMLCLNVDDDDGNAASVPVSLDKGTLEQIATCTTLEELEGVWQAYRALQSNAEFKTAIQRRKSEIK